MVICFIVLSTVNSELLYVAELARHGARYPINPYYDYLDTVHDAGELTAVGMRQHLNFGRYLRRMYIQQEQLLRSSYDQSQVEVWSTQYKRTIESAEAQMMGLFPVGTGPLIPDGVTADRLSPPFENSSSGTNAQDFALPNGLQVVPVLNGEYYLQNCDSYKQWEEVMIAQNFADYSNVTVYYAPFIERLRKMFNLTVEQSTLVGLSRLYDTLLCDYYLGRPIPLSADDMDNLRHLHEYLYMVIHSGTYSRIISTPFLQKVVSDLDQRLNSTSLRRATIFIGHDTNISPVLNFLNFSSFHCIELLWQKKPVDAFLNCERGAGFASNILFELRRDQSGEPYIKVLYNGKEMNLCNRKATTCAYAEWRKLVVDRFVDFEKLCSVSFRPTTHQTE